MDSDLLLEDTNLAMLGSIYEKALRLQRAEGEPQWKTIKKEPSFHIWRIEKFSVQPWPKDQRSIWNILSRRYIHNSFNNKRP